jgi:hypothetical protein
MNRMIYTLMFALLAICCLASLAPAQDATLALTLKEAIRRGVEKNLDVRAELYTPAQFEADINRSTTRSLAPRPVTTERPRHRPAPSVTAITEHNSSNLTHPLVSFSGAAQLRQSASTTLIRAIMPILPVPLQSLMITGSRA